jgi:hypothetical protein
MTDPAAANAAGPATGASASPRVTGEVVLELLRQVVAERPDHVYRRHTDGIACRYAHNGAPDCLAGHVLYRAGVPLRTLERAKGLIDTFYGPFSTLLDNRALVILRTAQSAQDDGLPWREALAAAEAEDVRDAGRGGPPDG